MSEFAIACETSDDGQHHVVGLSGELDFASVPAVRAFLLRLNGDVEVNCTGLDFVDSAGLGLFVAYHQALAQQGKRLRLRRLSGDCYRLFEVAGLITYLDLETAASEAG